MARKISVKKPVVKARRKRMKLVWTVCAKECYDRCCECSGTCANYEYCMKLAKELKSEPPMKKTVMALIDGGVPFPSYLDDDYVNRLTERETKVLKVFFTISKDSYDVNKDIKQVAKILEVTRYDITSVLANLCNKFADFFDCIGLDGVEKYTNFFDWAREVILPKMIARNMIEI